MFSPLRPADVTLEQHLANAQAIAALIDHTLLKPEATETDVIRLCAEAAEHNFHSVCINPYWVRLAHEKLEGTTVRVCTVVGFPLGANRTVTKLIETREALADGATEIDMVQNIGALRSGDTSLVQEEIAELSSLVHAHGALLKVILETCLLNDEQKTTACRLSLESKADFVKTSTGFSSGGATEGDVRLMRAVVGPSMGVKASGGIRSFDALRLMVSAGANRIGSSSGVQILREFSEGSKPAAPPVGTGSSTGAY